MTDLAHHLGGIHRWARTAVVEGPSDERTVDAPSDRAALVDWFRAGASALTETLRATDPATPCWTFGPRPRVAAFWFRRQAHETVLHAHDAAASQGAAGPLDPELALDGVDEVVTMFFPARSGSAGPPRSRCRWPRPGGGRAVAPPGDDDPTSDPAATVSGPAEAVLLLLWHRIALDDPRLRSPAPGPPPTPCSRRP